jgi:hypothetical protein
MQMFSVERSAPAVRAAPDAGRDGGAEPGGPARWQEPLDGNPHASATSRSVRKRRSTSFSVSSNASS